MVLSEVKCHPVKTMVDGRKDGWMNVFELEWKKWNGWKGRKCCFFSGVGQEDGGWMGARSGDDIIGQCNDPKATGKGRITARERETR